MVTSPTPPPAMASTATQNPTAAAAPNTLVYVKTIYNTTSSPVSVGNVTMNYKDLTSELPNGYFLKTTIYPTGTFSSDTISIVQRVVTYSNLNIPAGGSVTFYVYYTDRNSTNWLGTPVVTTANDFISLTVQISSFSSCVK
ncbi:MAG: hypothetical protein WCP19_06335 [Chloroflexota bacterium]